MTKLVLSLAALAFFFGSAFAADERITERRLNNNGVYQEENGLVVMEMENTPAEEDWKFETKVKGYTGTGYLRMAGNSIRDGPPNGRMSFFFKITNPGPYHMAIRSNKDNEDPTFSNDCWTKIVGQPGYLGKDTKTYMHGPSHTWSWSTVLQPKGSHGKVAKYEFDAGIHELQVSGRSQGFYIDRIIFYRIKLTKKDQALLLTNPESKRIYSYASEPEPVPVPEPVPEPVPAPAPAPAPEEGPTGTSTQFALHLNSGSQGYFFDGVQWETDTAYVTGGQTYGNRKRIMNTSNQRLYKSERYGDFVYNIPVPMGRRYFIEIHLAEIFKGNHGNDKRLFNIAIDGIMAFEDVDIYEQSGGPHTAMILTYETEIINDGLLQIEFISTYESAKCSGITVVSF